MRPIVLLVALLAAGCAGKKQTGPEPGPPGGAIPTENGQSTETNRSGLIVTPATQMQGKVALVNPKARYVVINFPIGTLPALDQQMPVYRNGLKVGEVRITGPQRDFNIAADIIAGECEVGDAVREK
jgi:hypothetical protein